MKPNKQPCAVCRNHKRDEPFKIRDDNGTLFTVRHICNCPYCGRFLAENYQPDGLTAGCTIIDEPPSQEYIDKAVRFLKELAPDAPERIIEITAANLAALSTKEDEK